MTKPKKKDALAVVEPAELTPEDATSRLALLQAAGITPARMSRLTADLFEVYEDALVAMKYTLGNQKKGRVKVPDMDMRMRAAKELAELFDLKRGKQSLAITAGKGGAVQVNIAPWLADAQAPKDIEPAQPTG